MKNYFEAFYAVRKANPRFRPSFMMFECPAFIMNAFLPGQMLK